MKLKHILPLFFLLSCDEPVKKSISAASFGGEPNQAHFAGTDSNDTELPQRLAGDDSQIFTPTESERDALPPSWPNEAMLNFELNDTDLTIFWPIAVDNTAVEAYSFYLNGQLHRRFAADTHQYTVQGLSTQESYEIAIIASDATHNYSRPLVADYQLQDQTPPQWSEESLVLVSDIRSTTAVVTWTAATDESSTLTYELSLNNDVVASIEGNTQYHLQDLEPNTTYSLEIKATDRASLTSQSSLVTEFKTLLGNGPTWSSDSTIIAEQSNPTAVTLTWTAPGHPDTTQYRIEENQVVKALINAKTWTDPNLITPGRYQYQVWAINEHGVTSDDSLQATLEAEDQSPPVWPNTAEVTLVSTSDQQLTLRWTEALDNHEISHYILTWGEQSLQVTSAMTTLDGLMSASPYSIQIKAVDMAGNESNQALTITARTNDNHAPRWPEQAELSLSWTSTGEFVVEWPSAEDNVGVVGYSIARNTSMPEQLAQVNSYRYEGLSAGEDHYIRVLAYDAAGHSTPLALEGTARRPNLTAPFWPENATLLASNLTETSVRLAWPSVVSNRESLTYVLRWGEHSQTTDDTSLQIDNLDPWTDYSFTLSAINQDGLQNAIDLTLQLKTLDLTSPQFLEPSPLVIEELGDTFIIVNWIAATDNVAISAYELTVNGSEPQQLVADLRQLRIDNLPILSTCSLSLQAIDPAGNRTQEPAQLTVQLIDNIHPWWPESASIHAQALSSNQVRLSWPNAQDNVSVSKYLVQVNEEGPSFEVITTSIELNELQPWQSYRLSVFAQDEAGLVSPTLETEIFTPDHHPPTWPNNATLLPSQITATEFTITWPEASDDVEVAHYRIHADGLLVGEVTADLRSFRLEDLTAAQMTLVEVVAVDLAGNESAKLMLSVQTIDGGPPTWIDPTLNWESGLYHIALSWSAAQDDVGVIGYRVMVNGEMKLETTELNATLDGLVKGQQYTIRIAAGDAANHWSMDGPTAEIPTLERSYDGFRRLSRLEYTRAVAQLFQGVYGTDEQPLYYCGDPYRAGYCRNAPNGFDGWVSVLLGENGPWRGYGLLGSYPEESKLRGEHELGGGFERLDQRLFDEHVGVWTSVAGNLTQKYFNTNNLRITGDIPWSQPDGAAAAVQWMRCEDDLGAADEYAEGLVAYTRVCFEDFINRFGSRALRRPLTEVEQNEFMGYFDAIPSAIPELFEVERQLHCWLEVNQPRWANPKPVPWIWTPEDEDWCAQVDENRLPAMYPTALHLEKAMVDFVPVVMTRPEFVYHIELGDEEGKLTSHELANRLSFHFWKAPPDQELRSLADNGTLLDEEIYAAQVDRLFADPRAEESVRTFYNGYFWIDSIPNHYMGANNYLQAQEDWHPSDIRALGNWYFTITFLGDAAKDELSNLGHYFTREQPGSYREMFQSNLNFFECQNPGNFQGCGGAGPFGMFVYKTGNCTDYQDCHERNWMPDTETGFIKGDIPQTIPEPNRHGLITRIGFLMHETDKERPIRRGLKIRDMLLCDPIPPPENCDVVRVPNLTGLCTQDGIQTGRECSHNSHCETGQVCEDPFRKNNLTVREVVEEMTEQEGTSCATCHARWINGMGHALGNYSSQGLYRPNEPMYLAANIWSRGQHVLSTSLRPQSEWPPYHTQGEFQFEGQHHTVSNAEELEEFLSESERLESCWVQQYFRYTMGRLETNSDRPLIESLADQLRNGASLADVFKGIAFTDPFKAISKPPSQLSSEDSP